MLRSCLALVAAIVLTALVGHTASAQLPTPLERALSQTPPEAAPERIALRMTVNDQSILVEIRPDGDGPSSYTLLLPEDEAALTEEQAEMWAGFQEDEDEAPEADGESYSVGTLDTGAMRDAIGGAATLLRDEAGTLVYGFAPQSLIGQGEDDGALQGLLDALTGEVEVDADHGHVSAIRFTLTAPFKPNFAARIHAFSLEQRYVHEPAIGGPRFAGMTMNMAGSAVFQPFDQTMAIDLVSVRYGASDGADALEAEAESP